MNNIIEIKNLTKEYPGFKLNNIDLVIPYGSIMGLVGENGAGKTTLIKAILNIVNRDSGTITVFNKDNIENEKMIKEDIGIVLDDAFFADTLKVKEVVKIVKCLYKNWDDQVFEHYLHEFDLPNNKMIKTFSKGMKKKLEIAVALSHHPRLLILDEPTSGLDPIVRSEILDILRDFIQDENKGVLLSSHITSDLEHVADYVSFISQGKLVFAESSEDLLDKYGIIKCNSETFDQIELNDMVNFKKYPYNDEILINDRKMIKSKYPNLVIDKPSIEEIMLLYIKGEKQCQD